MKTKELIEMLQEADPSGDLEVCVDNMDIHFAEVQEAYYDGCLQVLDRDRSCQFYNVVGVRILDSGWKVCLHTLSLADAILNKPDVEVDLSSLAPSRRRGTEEYVERIRSAVKKMKEDVEREHFVKWAVAFIRENIPLDDSKFDLSQKASDFFDGNLSSKDPVPGDIPVLGESHNSRREKQWGREVKFEFDGFDVHLRLERPEKVSA